MSPYLEIPKDQKLVDHRVALTSQLIYIAPPKFLPGATDPFAGRVRQKLLTRKRQSLAVDAVLKSLPVLEHARTTKSRASRKTGAARMPKARSTSVHVRGQIVPMAAAAREIAAARKACAAAVSGTDEQYLEACCQLFQRRAALEMLALAAHRGGLSEGGRNDGALMIASAIAASLPFTTGSIQLRRQIRDMLKLVVSEEWIDSEWEGSGDLSVMGRFEEDALREAVTLKSGRRYAYSKPRLLDEWQPTQDEVDALGLMSLCSEKQRSASRRATAKAAKAPADTPWEAKVRILAPEAQRLHASGRSLRGIVSATGIPISTVRRLLAAVPAVRAAPVIAPVPVAQIELAEGQIDAAVEMALVRGDDYADVLATQLGLTTDQVRGAALRLGQPELILPAGLALAA
jgi:hypothetical protein